VKNPSLFCAWLALGTILAALPSRADEALRFEAEDCVVNKEAVLKDKSTPNHWMFWTTDTDAQRKWSGGSVLKSPEVKADRDSAEAGAPPLHLVVKGIPKGVYDVRVKRGRELAVSPDGQQWRRMDNDVVARDVQIDTGAYEFWVDDRYAAEKPEQRGASYLDWIVLERAAPLVRGVWNGDFEALADDKPLGWSLPQSESVAVAVAPAEGRAGRSALRLAVQPGDAIRCECQCRRPIPVTAGQSLLLSAWLKGRIQRAAAVTVDGLASGKLVKRLLGQAVLEDADQWTKYCGSFTVPEGVTEVLLSVRVSGPADLLIDDIALEPGTAPVRPGVKVQGWATTRVKEKVDRGVIALRTPQGVYVGWRLLDSDPTDVAFQVFRSVDGGQPVLVQPEPITRTCDLVDRAVPQQGEVVYRVVPQNGVQPAGEARLAPAVEGTPHLKIRLKEPDPVANRVAVADLDGDGAYDFVIKHPNQSIDPAGTYWRRPTDTYKLDAYTSRGEFLWRRDLGWSIETGVWYAPYIACDLDGDGCAEVITKTGEGDPRDEDGRVRTGPEWLTVIDGRTGRDVCRVPWPSRKGFAEYSRISRNQLAMAYLDGKTPCVLALRGTYCRMKVDAYQLVGGALQKLWSYDNATQPTSYWGQGAHTTRVADVDGDGRDEILLGSACLDDDGTPLWTTGRGHPDGAHLGDLLPSRPGLEVFYCVETAQAVDGGLCAVDAATGKSLWALQGPTRHVHSGGMCSDLDPALPGCECYGADIDKTKRSDRGWLFHIDGTLLGTGLRYGATAPTVFWDADLQREVFRGRIFKHDGGVLEARPESGKVVDLLGDWREEIISAAPGELRIYSTTLPAMDRRVCLTQDPIYRACVCMSSMGYETPPTISVPPAALAPNLNLRHVRDGDSHACRVVVSTPPGRAISGTLALRAEGPFTLASDRLSVDVQPGQVFTQTIALQGLPTGKPLTGRILAELKTQQGVLRGETWFELPGLAPPVAALTQAEAFSTQGGGQVQVRALDSTAKVKVISHWDQKGHFLQWSVDVPANGRYDLLLRYHAADKVTRRLCVDDAEVGEISFFATRGTGDRPQDWDEMTFVNSDGKPFTLKSGKHTIRLENTDGHALDLDYLGFSRGR